MNHEKYIELNTLSLYGELSSEEQEELVQHLMNCSSCLIDLAEKNRVKSLLSDNRMNQMVTDEMLTNSRRDLRLALSKESNESFFHKILSNTVEFFSGYYKYILTAAAAIMIGLFLGSEMTPFSTNTVGGIKILPASQQQSLLQNGASILNVEFINNDASTGEVEFTFDAVKKVHMKGNVNDQQIQSLLTYAMVNGQNSGIKLNSLSLINGQADSKIDAEVKSAALNLVKNDPNPGVRREALKLIRKIPYDEEVKKTLLYLLSNDKNSGIRIEAINIIVEAKKEGSKISNKDVDMFKTKLQNDESQYMQYKFRTVLQENI